MGTMSVAFVKTGVDSEGRRFDDVDATFSASYATGGDTLPLAKLSVKDVDEILVHPGTQGSTVALGGTNVAPTILLYTSAATQAANASNNTATTVRLRVIGT